MHDYNRQARIYWWAIAAIGYALLAYSLVAIGTRPAATVLHIAMVVGFVCAVAFFPVRIPGTTMSFSGGEIFIFLALLLFGVEAAVVVAAVEGGIGAARTSKRWTSWFGTPAMAAMATLVTGSAFLGTQAMLAKQGVMSGAAMLLLMTAFAMLYFALTNFLPAQLLALKRNERLDVLGLLGDRSWMAMAHLCSVAIASFVHLANASVDVWILLAALPAILIAHWVVHSMLERLDRELKA